MALCLGLLHSDTARSVRMALSSPVTAIPEEHPEIPNPTKTPALRLRGPRVLGARVHTRAIGPWIDDPWKDEDENGSIEKAVAWHFE